MKLWLSPLWEYIILKRVNAFKNSRYLPIRILNLFLSLFKKILNFYQKKLLFRLLSSSRTNNLKKKMPTQKYVLNGKVKVKNMIFHQSYVSTCLTHTLTSWQLSVTSVLNAVLLVQRPAPCSIFLLLATTRFPKVFWMSSTYHWRVRSTRQL